MTASWLSAAALSIPMAVAAGLVGAFAVMRRMTLAADAISHVALPGIGLAIILHVDPLAGALVTLLLGALLIWGIERRTHLATETIIGVVFASALAIGSMMTSGEELIDALFGESRSLSPIESTIGVACAGMVIAFILLRRHQIVLSLVSPEIAHISGVRVARLDLQFLIVFAVTVALGLRYLGALLMGALIIIPAATARRIVGSLTQMMVASAALAAGAMIVGMGLAAAMHQRTGPMITCVAGATFFLTLFLRPRR